MDRSSFALALVAAAGLSAAPASDAAPRATATRITIWGGQYGGTEYGEALEETNATTGGLIAETRELDVATGDVRLTGIAATADPASVHLRDLTEPAIAIAEQRFFGGALTSLDLLTRNIGSPITVVTPKGELAGVLRSADAQAIVVQVGAGDQKRLAVLRRDYVQDVRLPAGRDEPSLVWRATTKQPGKHAIELSYRASGLTWTADYLAVLDDAARTVDLSAWATVKNASGATFERAELTLVATAPGATGAPARFTIPQPIRLGSGETVQVALLPARAGVKAQPVATYEAMEDPSAGYQESPGLDCSENNGTALGSGTAETAIELAMPVQQALPAGRVRMFLRRGDRLDIASEDQLRSSGGIARIKLAADGQIAGQRKALSCVSDENAQTIREKVQVRVENRGAQAIDVVIREYLWRWTAWKLEAEDKKGTKRSAQTQEYRVRVPAKGAQTVTYSVLYTW